MSPNYYREQMCEAKMDPESPESVEQKVDVMNGKSPSSATSSNSGETIKSEKELLDHHHHHHHTDQPLTPQSQVCEEEEDDEGEEDEDDDRELSSDDMISVGGSPSPSPSLSSENHHHSIIHHRSSKNKEHLDEYFRPYKKLKMVKVEPPSSQNGPGLKSFSISDILSHKPASVNLLNHGLENNSPGMLTSHQRIVRPWDAHQQQQQPHTPHHHHPHSQKSNGRRNSSDSSPLDALFQMTSKTFEGLNGHHDSTEMGGQGNAHQAFNSRQPPKKKRKSRTAFTNHQIFELEKRFLYQKYLSPADRDDIAQQLGLTNAQVITWFQNRRAKLKRDMEELKKDMESAKLLSVHKTFLENAQDLGLLKKRVQSQMDMSSAAAAAAFHISSPTSSSQSSHSPINLTSESPPSTH